MSMSSPGLGSNLDVNSIVSQLMSLEKRPLTAMAKQEANFQAKISALGSLQGAISSVQNAAIGLVPGTGVTAVQKFSVFRASVADSSIASVATTSSAVAGSYTLEITQLAKQHSIATATGATSPFTADGKLTTGGTLTLSLDSAGGSSPNKSTDIAIADGATVETIRDAINGASAGVSAVVINGTAGKQLLLTSTTAGSNQFIKLSGIAGLAYDPNATPDPVTDPWAQTQAAQGAALKINGIAVTSTTNSVSSAIDGVTLTLQKGPEAPATSLSTSLSITKDTSSLTAGINALVKAFNEFYSTAGNLGRYDAATKTAGTLNGDSTLLAAQNGFRKALGSVPAELSGATLKTLGDIGISVQKDGKLAVDSTQLSKAITDDFTAVANLAAAYGKALKTTADGMVGSDGMIAARSDGLNALIRGLEKQSDVLNQRLTSIESRYRNQFTTLDTLISGMTKTSSFLTQQLAILSNTTVSINKN
ncbi:MAG TPA: flagellar filament capping protein FliD [Accumulibacter sp.]|nr:flagellar filament capping protein FliD [Accumulibacter sp.]HMW16335.1 flagellar filament capping protein FliD [Accumulibacter sp.]HMX21980.1 flagellar filament capping protein FliD [Accumulibacter sp.]HMY07310.1 flagellar filament capping protein FliD [Accumulibacter sp.]HNC17090.1 flagellar filament capping protein FliD [Accumulibacter sp.]